MGECLNKVWGLCLQLVWTHFDPKRRGFIGVHRIQEMVVALAAPLGHTEPSATWLRPLRFEAWSARQRRGVPFADMLLALLHHRMGPQVHSCPGQHLARFL